MYIVLGLVAVWLGFLVGRQTRWAVWHGPVGAALVIPLAIAVGSDPLLSIVAPVCLGGGFLIARVAA